MYLKNFGKIRAICAILIIFAGLNQSLLLADFYDIWWHMNTYFSMGFCHKTNNHQVWRQKDRSKTVARNSAYQKSRTDLKMVEISVVTSLRHERRWPVRFRMRPPPVCCHSTTRCWIYCQCWVSPARTTTTVKTSTYTHTKLY